MMEKIRVVSVRMSPEMYERIKEQARVEHRSINQQIRMYIENQMHADKQRVEHFPMKEADQ